MVIWIIGRSGSGKTFFAKKLKSALTISKIIHIDGDEVRKFFFDNELGYSIKDRKKNSLFIMKLCQYLEKKGFIVICSLQSIFTEHQKLNKKKFNKYYQIYIKVYFEKLKQRNNKNVYSNKKNVVGKDIKFPIPYKSNYIFENKFNNTYKPHISKIVKRLSKLFK